MNVPNPQNIESITYQLLQQIDDAASIRGQLPVLTIQFQDENSIVRNKVVNFVEMLPYLRMLKSKATLMNKSLICVPESTYDKKIVITYGDPIDPPIYGNFTVINLVTPADEILVNGLLDVNFNVVSAFGYQDGWPLNNQQRLRGTINEPISGVCRLIIENNTDGDIPVCIAVLGTTSTIELPAGLFPGNNVCNIPIVFTANQSLSIVVYNRGTQPPPPDPPVLTEFEGGIDIFNSGPGVCSDNRPIWTTGTLVPLTGNLFLDEDGTIPVVGYLRVRNGGGTVYELDPINGLVGADTGESC